MNVPSQVSERDMADPALRLRRDIFDELVSDRQLATQTEQAEAFRVTSRTIRRLRRGETQPSLATAMRMAEVLGVPLTVLFEQVEAGR